MINPCGWLPPWRQLPRRWSLQSRSASHGEGSCNGNCNGCNRHCHDCCHCHNHNFQMHYWHDHGHNSISISIMQRGFLHENCDRTGVLVSISVTLWVVSPSWSWGSPSKKLAWTWKENYKYQVVGDNISLTMCCHDHDQYCSVILSITYQVEQDWPLSRLGDSQSYRPDQVSRQPLKSPLNINIWQVQ